MAASLGDLYERDFYAWTRDQARALRRLKETRPNVAIDLTHLILEVEDLGKSERDAVRSYLRTIIEHRLKLAYSPPTEPLAGWTSTIGRARTRRGGQSCHRVCGGTQMATCHSRQSLADARICYRSKSNSR